jgi:hypothetical protein
VGSQGTILQFIDVKGPLDLHSFQFGCFPEDWVADHLSTHPIHSVWDIFVEFLQPLALDEPQQHLVPQLQSWVQAGVPSGSWRRSRVTD